MKGVGILMKPGFIMTFCSVRKLFLAVPNTVCCSVEHRRPDNNLAAKTSKNKSHPFFFLFFLSEEMLQHHTFFPVQTVKPLQAEELCMTLNSEIVSFWFSAVFCSQNGVFSLVLAEKKEEIKGHGVDSNTFCCLGLPKEEHLGGSSGIVCSDEEVEVELTPPLSGVGVFPGGLC